MLWRERRKSNGSLQVSVKLPVDATSRKIAESETQRLCQSVIPIVGTGTGGRPFLVGSSVLLVYKDRKVLVTAAHVLSDNPNVPLHLFGDSGWSRPLLCDFIVSAEDDLAATVLGDEDVQALRHRVFLPEASIARSEPGRPFYASVVGYPATASRLKAATTLDTPQEAYFQSGIEQIDGSVTVIFDKKEGASGERGHVNVRDPIGKSGGAVFAMKVEGTAVLPNQEAMLVGIATRWKRTEKMIVGSGVTRLTPLLDELVGRNR